MSTQPDIAVITKSEFAAAVEFDEAAALRNIQAIRPGMGSLKLSATTGEGIRESIEFLVFQRRRSRAAAGV